MQGYFYLWVIVSIVWGLVASCIAVVMPVWEVNLLCPAPLYLPALSWKNAVQSAVAHAVSQE